MFKEMFIEKDSPEVLLLSVIFGREGLCYSYIVIEKEGKETKLALAEELDEVLSTLPLGRGRKDPQPWPRMRKVLELRFGFQDGKPRSRKQIVQELSGVSRGMARQLETKALRLLRHPSRSGRLREFLVPSSEEMARLKRRFQKLELELLEKRHGEQIQKELALPQEESTRYEAAQRFLDTCKVDFPNNRVWNTLLRWNGRQRKRERGYIDSWSKLRDLIKTGGISRIYQVGPKSIEFIREVLALQSREQASS